MSVQLIPINERKARRFTPKQKLMILKEWEQTGNGVSPRKKAMTGTPDQVVTEDGTKRIEIARAMGLYVPLLE
jgi:hypothetical protein